MKKIGATLVMVGAVLIAAPAQADDWQRQFFGHSSAYRNVDDPSYRYKRRYLRPQVRGWQRVVKPDHHHADHRGRCLDRMTTVGDQHLTIDGAKDQAIKAVRQMIRFTAGERFTDIGNAEGVNFRCVQSSIGDALGQSLHRCEITLEACTAPKIPGK